uniref:Protein regulator of cytokinesis 1 n=1 Tax=Elaeophora elaphi TaxID=1147741 RepID=A0A0R3S3B8_9BILA
MTKESLSRRRVSVNFSTAEAVSSIRDTIDRLNHLWDRISMEECMRCKRIEKFFLYISDLLNQMVVDEEEMVEGIQGGIEEMNKQVEDLCKELHLPLTGRTHMKPGSLALYRALHQDVGRLQSLKEDRLQGQKKLIEELAKLAVQTGEEIEDLPSSIAVCDDATIARLQGRVSHLNELLVRRMESCKQWQVDMKRWYKQMGSIPSKELGKTFIALDLDSEELVWDKHFLDEFESAFDEVKAEYNEWIEQACFDYTETLLRLGELWDLCHVPDVERNIAREFNPSIHTVHDIQLAKEQVKSLEKFLADRAEVYKKMKEWKDLWNEKVEFERRANDKSRYHNRGCELQTALKRQKFIANRLPIIKSELKEEVEKYESTHDNQILMDGLSPCEHIESIMDEYRVNKELERKRKKQMEISTSSTSNVSNMVTPKKRGAPSAFATPCSSAKIAKVKPLTRLDQTTSKACLTPGTLLSHMKSVSASTASLHSVITPVRPPTIGPKTSSPLRSTDKGTKKPLKGFNLPPIYKTPRK